MMGIRIYNYARVPTPYNVFTSSLTRGIWLPVFQEDALVTLDG